LHPFYFAKLNDPAAARGPATILASRPNAQLKGMVE
jgi:hypothetical protein